MTISSADAEALDLLQTRRAAFIAAAAPRLLGADINTPTDAAATASKLLDMTIAAYQGQSAPVAAVRGLPRAAYARFGDYLVPLLNDVLGTTLSARFLARCVDAYWRGATTALAEA